MPLVTEFIHRGAPQWLPWGWWHVQRFIDAYNEEVGEEVRKITPLGQLTEYTFADRHEYTDPTDGEVLIIVPGDKFRWWRE